MPEASNFSKNYGQQSGILAGLRASHGDIIVCLDDDGQTPANETGKLLEKIEEGYDICFASYDHKQHSLYRNLGSKLNSRMAEWLLGKPRELYISSFCAIKRYVVNELIKYSNPFVYLLGTELQITRNIANVPVHHRKREVGSSGYNFWKLVGLWLNGFTAFSVKPLRIATAVGGCFSFAAFIYALYTVIHKFISPNTPIGFASLMTAIMFFGGMIMLMLGLVGEYIGRTFITISNAPQYVIKETTQDEKDNKFNKDEAHQSK